MTKHYIPGIALLFILTVFSCVPNRKYVYLQKGDVRSSELPMDTVVRDYDYNNFNYRLQPQDVISIRFESLTTKEFDFISKNAAAQANLLQPGGALLAGELIDIEGYVPFPFLGKVKVAGLTVFQAQDSLQKIANRYLENPIVRVRHLNFRITVLGEVNKEGSVTIGNNRASVLEALGLAGGLTDLADKSKIKVIRDTGGKIEVSYINVLTEEFIASPYYFVHQNDILIVPPLRQRPYRKYFGQNFSLVLSLLTLGVLFVNLNR